MRKTLFAILLISFFIIPFIPVSIASSQDNGSVQYPTIDGFWSPNEWPPSVVHNYKFGNLLDVQFGYRINATHIFMTARYFDDSPSFYQKSCQSKLYKVCSDAFAVGFDNNGDQQYMGSKSSPDDSLFIGSEGNYSIDTYMQGIGQKIVYDTEVGGINNTFGRYSYNNETHYFTFEMVKALKSGDSLGHDINLNQGSQIFIMLAYWNNLPPRVEISSFTQWIKITITDPLKGTDLLSYFLPLFLASIIVITLVVVIVLINTIFFKTN